MFTAFHIIPAHNVRFKSNQLLRLLIPQFFLIIGGVQMQHRTHDNGDYFAVGLFLQKQIIYKKKKILISPSRVPRTVQRKKTLASSVYHNKTRKHHVGVLPLGWNDFQQCIP